MPKHAKPSLEDKNIIEGTEENDQLVGTDEADALLAGEGDDTVAGGEGDDLLAGGFGDDQLSGDAGNDRLGDGSGDDTLSGGAGDDGLRASLGADKLEGGDGNDKLISLADAGEPDPAQDPDGRVTADQDLAADDTLTGGDGADEFIFRPLINATEEVIAAHTDPETGRVDWRAVAKENDNVHDHWVEGIGNDVITDYSAEEGDTIVISGHTVSVDISYGDSDDDGIDDYTLLTLSSDQSANGGGAHDGDALGTITVLDAILTEEDIVVRPGGFAAVDRLDTWDA